MEKALKTITLSDEERRRFLHNVEILAKVIPFLRWAVIAVLVLQVGLVLQLTVRGGNIDKVEASSNAAVEAARSVEANLLRIEAEIDAPSEEGDTPSGDEIREGLEAAIQIRDVYCAANPNSCAAVIPPTTTGDPTP